MTRNVIFAESQDLRECPLHPGVTVGEAGMNPHNDGETRHIHTICPPQIEEDIPKPPEITSHPPEAMPCRSTHISKLLKNSPEKFPGTYMQVIDTIPEGYVHFSFNNNEWCNLRNKVNPISYRDAFSRPDVPLWQAAYEDEMKSLHDHKVWDLIPRDQVPAGRKVIPSKPVFHYKHD